MVKKKESAPARAPTLEEVQQIGRAISDALRDLADARDSVLAAARDPIADEEALASAERETERCRSAAVASLMELESALSLRVGFVPELPELSAGLCDPVRAARCVRAAGEAAERDRSWSTSMLDWSMAVEQIVRSLRLRRTG